MPNYVNTLIAAKLKAKCRKLTHQQPAMCFGRMAYRFSITRGGTVSIIEELEGQDQINFFEGQGDRIVAFCQGSTIRAETIKGFSGNPPVGGRTKGEKPNSARHSGQTFTMDGGACVAYIVKFWPPGGVITPPVINPGFTTQLSR